jgi:transposase
MSKYECDCISPIKKTSLSIPVTVESANPCTCVGGERKTNDGGTCATCNGTITGGRRKKRRRRRKSRKKSRKRKNKTRKRKRKKSRKRRKR